MLGTTGLAGGGDRDPDLLGVDLLERGTGATLRDLPLGGVPLGHAKPRGRAELVGDRQHPLDETLDTRPGRKRIASLEVDQVAREPVPDRAPEVLFDQAAREALRRGVQKVASAVRPTLGPRGRTVVIDKSWGAPTVTKDGVSVCEEVELSDPFENMAAKMIKEAASKTSDLAGDGTTTAATLADAIFSEGLRVVVAGGSPMALSRGIQRAAETLGLSRAALYRRLEKFGIRAAE